MSFADRFGKIKQFTLQSVGKAEKTEESGDFLELVDGMKKTKTELTTLLDAAKKYHRRETEANESFEALSGAFAKVTSSEAPARASLLAYVPMISKSAVAKTEMLNVFKVNIIDVINNILEMQQKQAEKAYKNLEAARLDMDAKQRSFRSTLENTKKSTQEDIDKAKIKADDAETEYNRCKEVCIETFNELEKVKLDFIRTKLSAFANAMGHYGASSAGEAATFIDENPV